jgi:hypothetical protein
LDTGDFLLRKENRLTDEEGAGDFKGEIDLVEDRLEGVSIFIDEPDKMLFKNDFALLDFALLDFALLDFALLDFAVLDFAVLDFAVLDFAVLDFAVLDFAVLDFAVLDFALLDFALLDFALDLEDRLDGVSATISTSSTRYPLKTLSKNAFSSFLVEIFKNGSFLIYTILRKKYKLN